MSPRLPAETKALIVHSYNQGASLKELSEMYSVAQSTIYTWIRNANDLLATADNNPKLKLSLPAATPIRSIGMWSQLDDYWNVLQSSGLADKSVEDYYYFAECFVRWAHGQFTPGGMVK